MERKFFLGYLLLILLSCSLETEKKQPLKLNKDTSEKIETTIQKKANKSIDNEDYTINNRQADRIFYIDSVTELIPDLIDENGNKITDVTWESSNEDIAKIETYSFLYAANPGFSTILEKSKKNPKRYKYFLAEIKDRPIKNIVVKSKKDDYIIAKTGYIKREFNFDDNIENQDSFYAEVEFEDGTKSNKLLWESNGSNIISIENGVIKGKNYGSVDIIVRAIHNKNQPAIFRANFLKDINILKKNCNDYEINYMFKYFDYANCLEYKNYFETAFYGKVYDNKGKAVKDSKILIKVNNVIQQKAIESKDGNYIFRNLPHDSNIQIIASKEGLSTRKINTYLKNSSSPSELFNFGSPFPNSPYSLQDEPEIINLKINGKEVIYSKENNIILNDRLDLQSKIKQANLNGIEPDQINIEVEFSESIIKEDIENNLRIYSIDKNNTKVLDKSSNSFVFNWIDEKNLNIILNNPLNSIKNDIYIIDFVEPFRDLTKTSAIKNKYFNFNEIKNDYVTFSIK
ncbi:MAG: hypothetical protein U0457_09505 [Candidatus Sericytochromatia bacterium]